MKKQRNQRLHTYATYEDWRSIWIGMWAWIGVMYYMDSLRLKGALQDAERS